MSEQTNVANLIDHAAAVAAVSSAAAVSSTTNIMAEISWWMPFLASTCAVFWYIIRFISWIRHKLGHIEKMPKDDGGGN